MSKDPIEAAAIAALQAKGYVVTEPDGTRHEPAPVPAMPPPERVVYRTRGDVEIVTLSGSVELPMDHPYEIRDHARRSIAQEIGAKLLADGHIKFRANGDYMRRTVAITGELLIGAPDARAEREKAERLAEAERLMEAARREHEDRLKRVIDDARAVLKPPPPSTYVWGSSDFAKIEERLLAHARANPKLQRTELAKMLGSYADTAILDELAFGTNSDKKG